MTLWQAIVKLDRLVFTTREIAALTGSSLSSTNQGLVRLEEKKLVQKMMRGVWASTHDRRFMPYLLVPFLSASHRCYVSFISALHLHGMISQIPQTITVASTAHTKKIITPIGRFSLHQLAPTFFEGFDWHASGQFLIASPEKALVDSLYLSSRRGKRYGFFPELEFPAHFNAAAAERWARCIANAEIRTAVVRKLEHFLKHRDTA